MYRPSRRVPTLVVIAAAFGVGAHLAPPVLAANHIHFNISAGPATVAINELGHEAGRQITYDYDSVKGLTTPALQGDFTVREALRRLLAGTGLKFEEGSGGAWFVSPKEKDSRAMSRQDAAPMVGPEKSSDTAKPQTVVVQSSGVTGEIPGLNDFGVFPIIIDSYQIDHSGMTSTADLINTLPQNFQGGPNENTFRGNSAETNSSFGSGVNLRGLSDDGTVVLLNGRRLAPSGLAGAFTDIGNIPVSFIDHMEVIPEGSTARFGVDAIGGVVNFLTRQQDGAETRAEVGGLSKGSVSEQRFSQFLGTHWDTGNITAAVEYDERDALPANRRLLATSDLTPFGGQNFDNTYGNPGTIQTVSSNGFATWAIPHGQNGVGLQPSQFTANTENLYDSRAGSDILPRQQLTSAALSGGQKIGQSTTLFFDALLSRRVARSLEGGEELPVTVTSKNPFYFNPAGGNDPVTVFYGFGRDLGSTVTLADLNSGQWVAGVDHEGGILDHFELYGSYAYEREHQIQSNLVKPNVLQQFLNGDPEHPLDPQTAMNVFGDGSNTNTGTLSAIRGHASLALNSRLESVDFSGYRDLLQLPGGKIRLTLDDEYRRQFLESVSMLPGAATGTPTEASRTTVSTFAQVRIPLVGATNRIAGIQSLSVLAAARYEHYSDVGPVTVPQFAIDYSPWQRLLLRSTWARLSHAPDLPDLSEANDISTLYLLPAKTGYTTALLWVGNNAQLRPETARSWTVAANVMPFEARNLSLALTYFNTDFTNRISDPVPLSINVLEDPSQAWLLRAVTPAEQAAVCNHSQFMGVGSDCLTTPVGAIVDLRRQNIATLDVQGMDMALDYALDHSLSVWKFRVNASYMFHYTEQQTPTTLPDNWVSTVHNPIRFRLRGWVSWERRRLFVTGTLNVQGRYRDVDSIPNRPISSWTTVNAVLGYDIPWGKRSTKFSVSAQNLFNHMPPFVNNQYGIGYDQENASLLGRVVSFQIWQRW